MASSCTAGEYDNTGAAVSSVNAKASLAAPTLPAASVWRTLTLLAPSPVRVKLLPLPAVQVAPLSMLYCQVAPVSRPVTLTEPLLVILSVAPAPVSATSARVWADGAAVSIVKAKASLAAPTLPAASVWRTLTLLAPSPVRVKRLPLPAVQVAPLSVLYCQVAPVSRPLTLTAPLLVILSVLPAPVSAASARVGADGAAVSSV